EGMYEFPPEQLCDKIAGREGKKGRTKSTYVALPRATRSTQTRSSPSVLVDSRLKADVRSTAKEDMAAPGMKDSSRKPNHREALQRQTQADWENRADIEVITGSIKKIADFLNTFDASCRYRLALLNEKLTTLERKIEYLEAKVTKGDTLT
ncbi:unnamed protein product, partial [Darwinula stevensoni]